jgi:hypothetical protein
MSLSIQYYILSTEMVALALLAVVTFVISSMALIKTTRDKKTSMLIALIISIFTVVYVSYSQLQLVALIQGIGGMAVLMLIPFIIAFFFMYNSEIAGVLRKMFWIFFGIMTVVLLQTTNLYPEMINIMTLSTIVIIGSLVIFDKNIKDWYNARKNLRRH